MAERQLPKLNVAGSIPVSRSKSSPRTHLSVVRHTRVCAMAASISATDHLLAVGGAVFLTTG